MSEGFMFPIKIYCFHKHPLKTNYIYQQLWINALLFEDEQKEAFLETFKNAGETIWNKLEEALKK